MTAMKPVLDFIIDANILLALAFSIWTCLHHIARVTWLRHDYFAQLRLLKLALCLTAISPLLAHTVVQASQSFWPSAPITVSDIAVAAYLRGDIALKAVEFETLLNARDRWVDAILTGKLPFVSVFLAIVIAGGIWHSVRTLRAALKVQHILIRSHVWRRTRRVDIRLSDTVTVPFAVRGFMRRHIVLPSTLVTQPRQMRFILAHESQHIREGDVEWELAFEVMRPFIYWNPAFVLWRHGFERLRELACDQAVILRRGIPLRDYSNCLLDFCSQRVAQPMPRAIPVAFVRRGAKKELLDRLLSLQKVARKRHWATAPALAICLTLGVSLSAASVRQSSDWSQDRLMLSSIVNLERFNAMNRGPVD